MVVEAGYNGVMGSHLQSQLLGYNQVPTSYLTAFGSVAQSIGVLNSKLGSSLANEWSIGEPYRGFIKQWGNRATVA